MEGIDKLYQALGGMEPTLRPGSWDLAARTETGEVIVIGLDEELHFNRYRRQTLSAPWYAGEIEVSESRFGSPPASRREEPTRELGRHAMRPPLLH